MAASRGSDARRRGSRASAFRARQGLRGRGRLGRVVRALCERQCAAARAHSATTRPQHGNGPRHLKAIFTREFFARPRRFRLPVGRPDLHRRHAAVGFDPARADPVQPLRGRGHDGASRDPHDRARAARPSGGTRPSAPTPTCSPRWTPRGCASSASGTSSAPASTARPAARSSSTRCRTTSCTSAMIHLILPNAKIIDARRHPIACCFSNYRQHFARGQRFSYDLTDLGRYYRDYVDLMAHFDAVLPGRVHRVYLRAHRRGHRDRGAPAARLLRPAIRAGSACDSLRMSARYGRRARSRSASPFTARAIDHWRHYEAWLEPLKLALGPVLTAYPDSPAT